MYYVYMYGHAYSYEIYEIVNIYFPGEKISICETVDGIPEDSRIIKSTIKVEKNIVYSEASLLVLRNSTLEELDSISLNLEIEHDIKKSIKHAVKLSAFKLLKDITKKEIPWGILVGIRPSKIVNDLRSKVVKDEDIRRILKDKYLLRDDKIKLVTEISHNSYDIINTDKKNVSIYIGIPFCPSRCVYCSFASYPILKFEDYIAKYMESLRYEIEKLSGFIDENFNVETLYIGGGTPTSLPDGIFEYFLSIVSDNFNTKSITEFTVEAGRPDTINEYKLQTMKHNYIGRISINPQTMNDDTLIKIGRNHTVKDIIEKFNMAREVGFEYINMDIILGLPGEDISHVEKTIDGIINLSPENITVHTMAVKRASRLKEKIIENEYIPLLDNTVIDNMMDYVHDSLHKNGYIPYYMYRQKQMVGNLENVGYSKKGFECIYNIQMIEEKETIIGIGADAVTKLVFLDENRIERMANKKDIKEYINTIHENTDKKLKFLSMLT